MKKNHNKKRGKRAYPRPKRANPALARRRAGRREENAPTRTQPPHPPVRTRHEEYEAEGLFSGTSRGFGFLTPDGGGEDIFIPAADTCGALDGDRVACRYHRFRAWRDGEERELTEGRITSILEERRDTLVGTVAITEEQMGRRLMRSDVLIPENRRLPTLPLLARRGARTGDKVEVRLLRDGRLACHVLRVFGAADDRAANYGAILAECGVPVEFSAEALDEAARVSQSLLDERARVRRTREVVFTLDGAGAKDLDDAISLSETEDGWRLSVHIADVSAYVRERGALDRAAVERGTSLYFADRVVPMLPPALSNGVCSLHPGEDKLALTADMTLDRDGNLLETAVSRTVIRSRIKGVYEEVNDLFEKGVQSPYAEKYKGILPALRRARRLYTKLAQKSRRRGMLELERPEASVVLDGEGNPVDVVLRTRGVAERMIEQFMLTANEGVARLLEEKGVPCIYRLHDRPTEERLRDFILYAHNLGLDTRPLEKAKPSARDFAALLDQAGEKGLTRAVSYTALRTMAKAAYSDAAGGHFGLGLSHYCHFTSPIRRLSDLITHRCLKAVLLDGAPAARYKRQAARAAEAANETELRALDAERQIDALYKTLYLSAHEGESYEAVVSSVTSFGLFCELENTCEGLIPIEELGEGFRFDERNLTLSNGTRVFRVGDLVRITVKGADISARRVRFAFVEQ